MYFAKVILHQVLFILFGSCICYCSDLNIVVKILGSLQAYIAGYFVSLWIMKFVFWCMCTTVKSDNKCVFITGCDSGFGNQTALQLNRLGFKVFATCMNPNGEGAKHLMGMADDASKMIVIGMDVTKDKDIETAYETVKNSMLPSERLYGLVNNAGIATACEFEFGPDLDECKNIIDVNLMGMIKVTRQFLPLIRQSKGRIVNVESLAGLLPIPHSIFYGISKTAAAGFSDNLRVEMYRFGVAVVSINPWLYKTALVSPKTLMNQYENCFRSSSEEVRKAYGAKFMQKGKLGLSVTNFATKSNAVPNTIVSALTTYEPDPRYIIAPMIYQPLVQTMLWLPKESLEVAYQVIETFFGSNQVYPEN